MTPLEKYQEFVNTLKTKNSILSIIQKEDPTRLKERTVAPKKGKGRKVRPRNSNRAEKE